MNTYGHLFVDKGAKKNSKKKRQPLQQMVLVQVRVSLQKNKTDPFFTPCTKLKSKWIKDLHIKPATLKLLEEKVGKSLEHIGTGKNFLNRTPIAYSLR